MRARPPEELGCLYWSANANTFVMPAPAAPLAADVSPHFGRPAGVLPQVEERSAGHTGT